MKTFKEFLDEQQVDEGIGSLLMKAAPYVAKAVKAAKPYIAPVKDVVRTLADPSGTKAARNIASKGKDAVLDYTVNSTSLNTALVNRARGAGLRSGMQKVLKPGWSLKPKEVTRRTANLDKAIKDSKLPKDTNLFHGTDINPHKMGTGSKGNVTVPSYLSTSKSGCEALTRAQSKTGLLQPPHVIKIKGKQGQTAHDVAGQTRYSSEREVLLPRNTELKIADKPTKLPRDWSNILNQSRRTRVWDAEIVSQGKRVAPSPNKVSVSRVAGDMVGKAPTAAVVGSGVAGIGYTAKGISDAEQRNQAKNDAWIKEFRSADKQRRQQMSDEFADKHGMPRIKQK